MIVVAAARNWDTITNLWEDRVNEPIAEATRGAEKSQQPGESPATFEPFGETIVSPLSLYRVVRRHEYEMRISTGEGSRKKTVRTHSVMMTDRPVHFPHFLPDDTAVYGASWSLPSDGSYRTVYVLEVAAGKERRVAGDWNTVTKACQGLQEAYDSDSISWAEARNITWYTGDVPIQSPCKLRMTR